jgi:quercetin dioxygenase-like cupin family protein
VLPFGSRNRQPLSTSGTAGRQTRRSKEDVNGEGRKARPGCIPIGLPEDIDWKPFSAFPPSVRLAIVVGEPTKPGPYVIRVKVPSGVKLMPHRHPEDRIYTVMSGVFYIGLGDRFDGDKVNAYPPGSVIVLPGDTWHFHWAKSGEYISQVNAIGPLGIEYQDPVNDPREQNRQPPAPSKI